MEKLKTFFSRDIVFSEDDKLAKSMYDKSRFGEPKGRKFYYSLFEALYLLEAGKVDVLDGRNKNIDFDSFLKKAKRIDKDFWIRYSVFKDMRSRGYIVKTALKFGADFRIYDRGVKPGQDHAKWILYPVSEAKGLTWHEFSAKNRVAHSTRKKLLIGIVDSEGDVTYYDVGWTRP
jgi:tRNA-intron endonuclease, archaea type